MIDYVAANGFFENNKVLTEQPFSTLGSIINLFEGHQIQKILANINEINTINQTA